MDEIIPISPRTDFLYASQDDTPTVAEVFLPYATAQIAKPIDTHEKSYGELWVSWANTTGFHHEM